MVASQCELWFNAPIMLKTEAIELLGGSVKDAALAIGVTYQAVDKWPDVLPARLVDRVQAALWRRANAAGASAPLSSALPAQAQAQAVALPHKEAA